MPSKLLLLSVGLGLSACASPPVPVISGPNALASRVSDSTRSHDILTAALAKGDAARISGDGEQLQQAAVVLRSVGTKQQGGEDLAANWQAEATRLGAKPVASVPYRGRVLGSAFSQGEIEGGSSYATQQMFLAGEPARISVVPRHGAILKLMVVDNGGKTLCDTQVDQPKATCDWLPVFTGRYRIVVQNSGDNKAGFYLVVN